MFLSVFTRLFPVETLLPFACHAQLRLNLTVQLFYSILDISTASTLVFKPKSFDFLSLRHSKLFYFISDIMDCFSAGNDKPRKDTQLSQCLMWTCQQPVSTLKGTQAKTSNVTKHLPTQFQLQVPRQQMGRAPDSAWLERRGLPSMMSSQFVSMCPGVCAI